MAAAQDGTRAASAPAAFCSNCGTRRCAIAGASARRSSGSRQIDSRLAATAPIGGRPARRRAISSTSKPCSWGRESQHAGGSDHAALAGARGRPHDGDARLLVGGHLEHPRLDVIAAELPVRDVVGGQLSEALRRLERLLLREQRMDARLSLPLLE
jgi:hypothetical protein